MVTKSSILHGGKVTNSIIPTPKDVVKLTLSYFFARAVFIITVWSVFIALFVAAAYLSVVYIEYKAEHTAEQIR